MGFNPGNWSIGGKKPFSSGGSYLNTFTPAGWLGFNFNDPTGAKGAAAAAQGAANAQAETAARTRKDIMDYSRRFESEAMDLAQASPQELIALDRSYGSAESALAREERLLSAIDPTLMEASSQALKLLRGETADANKPLTAQRTMQRQQLVDSLRAQYGSGAESTSIGQRALQQFDMQSNSMFQTNQQNSLNQIFGIATTDFGARQQRAIGGLEQAGQGYSALQTRVLNTRLNTGAQTLGALSGTSQQMIQTAGAPYVGQAIQAQGQQQLFNTGLSALSYGAMSYGGGSGGGGARPSAAG